MAIKVVIGANYGDEGKGLMTDYFAHRETAMGRSCLVVCHNGGSQRGHTVVTPSGKRHVFQHFGSGTYSGADTFLAEDYIVNPITFRMEYEALVKKMPVPRIFIHPNCLITTPFDMIANQLAERDRGDERHGSCGWGIWETIERNSALMFRAADALKDRDGILDLLHTIRDDYLMNRLSRVGVHKIPAEMLRVIESDNLISHYIDDVIFMFRHAQVADNIIVKNYDSTIFEGGQGLLLDQSGYSEETPHTTPSNTGLQNPIRIIKSAYDVTPEIEVCYVSRTYLTRHGAGPLPNECDRAAIGPRIVDNTNVTNEFQGRLRFAPLNVPRLLTRVQTDLKFGEGMNVSSSIAFTHLNECGLAADEVGLCLNNMYTSDGLTRDSVQLNTRIAAGIK